MALNHNIHRQKMLEIVHALFKSPIGKYCAFKGGTLALFIHQLDRFSTDVDIDLLDISKEKLVLDTIDSILHPLGRIKNKVVGKTLHRWVLSYGETDMNIKVELNKRIRNNNVYTVTSLYGVDCKIMNQTSMATNKLVALSERRANRDLYDTRFFRKQ
jgi:predicted nucleotidyltransferase component of viral defense system